MMFLDYTDFDPRKFHGWGNIFSTEEEKEKQIWVLLQLEPILKWFDRQKIKSSSSGIRVFIGSNIFSLFYMDRFHYSFVGGSIWITTDGESNMINQKNFDAEKEISRITDYFLSLPEFQWMEVIAQTDTNS